MKMRDESFADLGDSNLADGVVTGDAPNFTVTTVNDYPTPGDNANIARRIRGTFEVPCYLTGGSPVPCGPGATMPLDSNGMPSQQGTYDANFDCVIPRAAVDGGTPTPARPSVYGHGLLGSASEANSSNQTSLARGHNIISCATDELGLSGADVPTAFAALGELGQFPKISDRLQQGLLNELLLGRLLVSPDGFVTDGEFHVDRTTGTASVIDPAKLYYNGNSQGGIMGGAFMALSPDATRGSLGVPGMNYSVLLNRSVDFDTYAEAGLNPNYTDMLERPLVLSMIQMLWDRGEANGYAHPDDHEPAAEHASARGADERGVRRSPGDQLGGRHRGADDRRIGARSGRRRRPLAGSRSALEHPADLELPVHRLGDRLLGQRPDA